MLALLLLLSADIFAALPLSLYLGLCLLMGTGFFGPLFLSHRRTIACGLPIVFVNPEWALPQEAGTVARLRVGK